MLTKTNNMLVDISINDYIKAPEAVIANTINTEEEDVSEHSFNVDEVSGSLESIGTVLSVADGVAKVSGLPDIFSGEILSIETSAGPIIALAFNLEQDVVGVVLLGNTDYLVSQGDRVLRQNRFATFPVGSTLVGRVVDTLGLTIDGGSALSPSLESKKIDIKGPGIIERFPVSQPMQTGTLAIDSMFPIGRGQRELILGDRAIGKTTIAIDTILSQKTTGVICVYVAIGQRKSGVVNIWQTFKSKGVLSYTTIISATAGDSASLVYLAPYAGTALAEFFRDLGGHSLIIYDDLSKQAVAYRQVALLLRRPPSREAYPGDIFYLHSRLLERSAKLNKKRGFGSLTALPIIETQGNDITAYIPTNVISITDGQIFLESDLFTKGVRPAINIGLSVSRIGSNAQTKAMKAVASTLKLELAQFREVEALVGLESDLDPTTKAWIERGKRLIELLKQKPNEPLHVNTQIALLTMVAAGIFDLIPVNKVSAFKEASITEASRIGYNDNSFNVATINKTQILQDWKAFVETFKNTNT